MDIYVYIKYKINVTNSLLFSFKERLLYNIVITFLYIITADDKQIKLPRKINFNLMLP